MRENMACNLQIRATSFCPALSIQSCGREPPTKGIQQGRRLGISSMPVRYGTIATPKALCAQHLNVNRHQVPVLGGAAVACKPSTVKSGNSSHAIFHRCLSPPSGCEAIRPFALSARGDSPFDCKPLIVCFCKGLLQTPSQVCQSVWSVCLCLVCLSVCLPALNLSVCLIVCCHCSCSASLLASVCVFGLCVWSLCLFLSVWCVCLSVSLVVCLSCFYSKRFAQFRQTKGR